MREQVSWAGLATILMLVACGSETEGNVAGSGGGASGAADDGGSTTGSRSAGGSSGAPSGGTGGALCPPCAAPPYPDCVGSGPCGCGPYTCPGDSGGAGGASATGCGIVAGDYGDCEMALGWGFDGTRCRAYSGCSCGADCASFFSTGVACAASCGAAGQCNPAAFAGGGIATSFTQGSFCDEIVACAGSGQEGEVEQLVTLASACAPSSQCPDTTCPTALSGTVDAGAWQDLCAVSLLPEVTLTCLVWGP